MPGDREVPLTIRPALIDDAEAVRELLIVFGYAPTALAHVPERLKDDERSPRVLVAERAGNVVGVGSLSVSVVLERLAPQARVTVLVVAESERRRRTGRALVAGLEELARALGCSRIELTSSYRLPAAHAFWRVAGYEETGLRFAKTLADEAPWHPPAD